MLTCNIQLLTLKQKTPQTIKPLYIYPEYIHSRLLEASYVLRWCTNHAGSGITVLQEFRLWVRVFWAKWKAFGSKDRLFAEGKWGSPLISLPILSYSKDLKGPALWQSSICYAAQWLLLLEKPVCSAHPSTIWAISHFVNNRMQEGDGMNTVYLAWWLVSLLRKILLIFELQTFCHRVDSNNQNFKKVPESPFLLKIYGVVSRKRLKKQACFQNLNPSISVLNLFDIFETSMNVFFVVRYFS